MAIAPVYANTWQDDFENGLGNWEEVLGDWEIESDGGNHFLVTPFVQSAQPAGGNDPWIRLAPGGELAEMEDATIEFKANLLEPGAAGVILRPIIRGTDVDHWYWFSLQSAV